MLDYVHAWLIKDLWANGSWFNILLNCHGLQMCHYVLEDDVDGHVQRVGTKCHSEQCSFCTLYIRIYTWHKSLEKLEHWSVSFIVFFIPPVNTSWTCGEIRTHLFLHEHDSDQINKVNCYLECNQHGWYNCLLMYRVLLSGCFVHHVCQYLDIWEI